MTRNIIVIAVITVLITFLMMVLTAMTGGYAAPMSVAANRGITLPIAVHLATVVPAFLLGPVVLWRKKGDARHRLLGRVWAGLMLITAIASAFIRAPGGGIAGTGYSVIHIFTLWTLINVPLAIWLARSGKIEHHRSAMIGLYVGLCVAGGFAFLPGRIVGNLVFG